MAVKFEFAPVPMPAGRPKKLRYYPRVVNRRTVSTSDIVKEIEMACTLTRTDVVAVLDALNRSLVNWLKDGWRVHLDGVGYFDVSLTAPETRDPKDTRASSVKFKSVNFRADKELRYRVAELKAERSKNGRHSARLSEIAIDMKLAEFFSENPMLVRRDLEKLCQMTRVTAVRCLKRLREEKKLKNINTSQQPVYIPVPGHYGVSVDR
ncbi:HU family DNA-binding protein [Bacteroides sp.]